MKNIYIPITLDVYVCDSYIYTTPFISTDKNTWKSIAPRMYVCHTCVELSVKRCTMVVLVARDWGKSLARASRFTHTQL